MAFNSHHETAVKLLYKALIVAWVSINGGGLVVSLYIGWIFSEVVLVNSNGDGGSVW